MFESCRRSALTQLVSLVLIVGACGPPEDAPTVPGSEPAEASPANTEVPAAGEPVRGDWLVLHLLADPENLNPLTSNDSASSSVMNWIFLSLLDLDNETLAQKPLIARELPEVSEDKLTYTFRLRDDVTFSDGKPLTAEDVVFAVKAIKHPEVAAPHARNYFESVRDVVAVDPYTVRFDLLQKYFRNDLVLGSLDPLPRHYYDPENHLEGISVEDLSNYDALEPERKTRASAFAKAFNENFQRNPMGPGAFALEDPENDLVTGVKIVLKRRPDFWAPDDPGLGDAWVNRIVFRVINDREAALVSLKRGDIDVTSLSPLQYQLNKGNERFNEKINTRVHISPGFSYLGWNMQRPVFQDVRVRRALSYFVDKQNIIDKILHGLGQPVESPIFIKRPEYNRNLQPWPYDPTKGKALLYEAGWVDTDGDGILDKEIDGKRTPLAFEIISNSGNDVRRDVALAIVDEFKKAGIGASFRALDWSIMLGQVRKSDFDAVILGWAMSVLVPDSYQIWHSSQAVDGGSNAVGYKNAEVDQILEEYRVTFDAPKRKELYDRFQEIIYEEQPYTFLFMQKAVTSWDRRFEGVTWYPSQQTDTHEWWVPADRQKY